MWPIQRKIETFDEEICGIFVVIMMIWCLDSVEEEDEWDGS